jgi:hypothetical protein
VEAFVLDVAKAEKLVDLTLKPEFMNISREKSSTSHTKKKVELLFPEWQIYIDIDIDIDILCARAPLSCIFVYSLHILKLGFGPNSTLPNRLVR